MASSKLSETRIGREVERLFGEISAKRGELCTNPGAREDFARNGPADAPRLPLEYWECERVRWSGRPLDYLTGQYARSVVPLCNVKGHPSFDDYARGVLWEHDHVPGSAIPFQPEQLAEMKKRFPPRKLEGLKCFCWLPPRQRNRANEKRRAA
jgi:hypothetical protein